MEEKLKVLHVVGRMDRGGTEALLMSLLREMKGEDVVYDFVEQTEDICDYDEEILSLGSKIYRCKALTTSNIMEYRQWWIDFLKQHPEYYIIHGHSRGSAPIYLDVAKKMGRRTIAHCHNNSNGRGLWALKRYIWQFPLRYIPEFCFACSKDSGYSQFGRKRKFEVILNGIQTKKYIWNPVLRDTLRKEMNLENVFVIGNVARFESQKNHEFLIDIFVEIKKIEPKAKLMLIGKGSKEDLIREKVERLSLNEDVLFMGLRSDVENLMQVMDVFLLPSHFEGLGIVNIEAQAAGLPCFVSDKVVPKEIQVTELVHFIPLHKSASYWANKIVEEKRLDTQRRDTSTDILNSGFDIETTKNYLNNFYRELYKGGKKFEK